MIWTIIVVRLKCILERFKVYISLARRVFFQESAPTILNLSPKLKAIESPCMSDSPSKEEVRDMIRETIQEEVPRMVEDVVTRTVKEIRKDFEDQYGIDARALLWVGDSSKIPRNIKTKVMSVIITAVVTAGLMLMLGGYKAFIQQSSHTQPPDSTTGATP